MMYVKGFVSNESPGFRVLLCSCVTLSRLLIAPDLLVYLPVEENSPLP